MDGPVDPSAAQQRLVRGVHDGVDGKLRDVVVDDDDAVWHGGESQRKTTGAVRRPERATRVCHVNRDIRRQRPTSISTHKADAVQRARRVTAQPRVRWRYLIRWGRSAS